MNKLKVGFTGVTQLNFEGGAAGGKEKLFQKSADGLKRLSHDLGFDLYVYPNLLITGDDAARASQAMESEHVDFLLIQSTTFAAGEIILCLSKMNAFIGLWALPETSMKDSFFVQSLNSFCGVNMYGSIITHYLKEYGIQFKWFYGHTEHELFKKRFEVTVRALAAIKRIRNSRVALIGGIAPGFNDLYFDERIGQKKLGVEIQRNHEFSEIRQRAEAYDDSEINAELEKSASHNGRLSDAAKESMKIHSRYYKAHLDFCMEYRYDALGISCWPKMQDETGCLSCSIIARLNQNGIPAACEGDLPGAVSMLLLKYIAGTPAALMDLSAVDEEDQTILMWHCGPAPDYYADSCGSCFTYSIQPNGTPVPKKIGLINNIVFKPQHLTFTRITGEWDRILVLDGNAIDAVKNSPHGSRGWIGDLRLNGNNISVRNLMNTILVQGLQHHYSMISGDITEELLEVASWLDIKPVKPVVYQNYFQRTEA